VTSGERAPIAFDRVGRGEPLVLVHANGMSGRAWRPVLPMLSRERDVIVIDLPGHGRSPPVPPHVTPAPPGFAWLLSRFLDELGIDRAHVAGNSLGGWVALELAKAGRAMSVTGLSTAGLWKRPLGPRPGADIRRIGRAALPLLPLLLGSARGRRLLLRSSVGHPERVPAAAGARLVRSYVTSPGFEGANAEMRAAVFSGVTQIRVPVTLAWGELDRLVRRPRETPPGWRTLVLRDCGHIPTWDDPEQVARVLLEAGRG
jgi:pimeloyl-ACP methyl ester carboxylesterase